MLSSLNGRWRWCMAGLWALGLGGGLVDARAIGAQAPVMVATVDTGTMLILYLVCHADTGVRLALALAVLALG